MSGNAAPLLNFLLTSSGIFPWLQVFYGLTVIVLVVTLCIMMHKNGTFQKNSEGKYKWSIYFKIVLPLIIILLLFAFLFFAFNVAMVNAIEEEKKKM